MMMKIQAVASKPGPAAHAGYRIGAVSFINTFPLIDGLENITDIEIRNAVPSRLIGLLEADEVDVALCSMVDYQHSELPLKIVPSGLLGCFGSTMTVRLFSQTPISRIERVYCDTDSHTSIMLLRVLLHQGYAIRPEFIDFHAQDHRTQDGHEINWPESMLLIGDKVVTDATPAIRYPYQLDLGAEWRELTGLPFVFAGWLAREDRDVSALAAVLDRQRRHNLERLNDILTRRVAQQNWPIDLARSYWRDMLKYEWNGPMQAGTERFFACLHEMGLIDRNKPLIFDGSLVE